MIDISDLELYIKKPASFSNLEFYNTQSVSARVLKSED